MINPQEKKAALESELRMVAKNYQEAQQVMQNCQIKIHQFKNKIHQFQNTSI